MSRIIADRAVQHLTYNTFNFYYELIVVLTLLLEVEFRPGVDPACSIKTYMLDQMDTMLKPTHAYHKQMQQHIRPAGEKKKQNSKMD